MTAYLEFSIHNRRGFAGNRRGTDVQDPRSQGLGIK